MLGKQDFCLSLPASKGNCSPIMEAGWYCFSYHGLRWSGTIAPVPLLLFSGCHGSLLVYSNRNFHSVLCGACWTDFTAYLPIMRENYAFCIILPLMNQQALKIANRGAASLHSPPLFPSHLLPCFSSSSIRKPFSLPA